MTIVLRLGAVVVVVAALLLVGRVAHGHHETSRWEAFAQERRSDAPTTVRDLGPIPPEVAESSGLAVSRAYPGVFWTHNDSGDEPRVYALDEQAALLATIDIEEAKARDWEDIDLGVCPEGSDVEWCLYIADTGDNGRQRESVRVYVVPEPDPGAGSASVSALYSVSFSYEGGAFDVEAIAATPDGGLVLATKGRAPTIWLFQIPAAEVLSAGTTGETLVLTDPIAVPIEPSFVVGRWLTGASLDAAGSVLALRTYTEVYFYEWPVSDHMVLVAPPCYLGPLEPIGEAIAFSSTDRIFLSSESPGSRQGRLLEIECAGVGG